MPTDVSFLSLLLYFSSNFLLWEKPWRMAQVPDLGNLEESLGSWLQPGSVLALVAILGISLCVEDLSLFPSLSHFVVLPLK